MVTKKQRRRRIADASAQRRAARLTARARRRRTLRAVAATLVVIVAVCGLVAWIVLRDGRQTTAGSATSPTALNDSAWRPAVPTMIEVFR